MTGGPSVLHEAMGSVVVYVGSAAAPRDDEWDAYLATLEAVGEKMGQVRIAIFTEGGAPSATQRKRAAELSSRYSHRAVVMSSDPVARTVVTVLSWLGTDIRAYAPSAVGEAFDRLELSEGERHWALEASARMRKRVKGQS